MMYKKVQTTVRTNGDSSTLSLGWVSGENLERDVEAERERFATVARTAVLWPGAGEAAIQAVEVAGLTIAAVYENGVLRVVNYVPEEGN